MRLSIPRNFLANEKGTLSIEAVLAVPILVWAMTATFVFWDAFKTLNISQKATYTVADMLSRETQDITPDYMTAMHEIFAYLAESGGNNALRVTVVTLNRDEDTEVETLEMVWSEGVGGIEGYSDIDAIRDRIPDMAPGDQMIVVESEQEWAPAFSVGLASYRFREVALARPRFGPTLDWDAG